jgi:hypothetical protein
MAPKRWYKYTLSDEVLYWSVVILLVVVFIFVAIHRREHGTKITLDTFTTERGQVP